MGVRSCGYEACIWLGSYSDYSSTRTRHKLYGHSPVWKGLDSNNLSHTPHLCGRSPVWDVLFSNVWPSKSRSRSRSTTFARRPCDGKCQNLQSSTFLRFSFSLWFDRPARTNLTYRRIDTETDKPTAIGKTLQICLTTNRQSKGTRQVDDSTNSRWCGPYCEQIDCRVCSGKSARWSRNTNGYTGSPAVGPTGALVRTVVGWMIRAEH